MKPGDMCYYNHPKRITQRGPRVKLVEKIEYGKIMYWIVRRPENPSVTWSAEPECLELIESPPVEVETKTKEEKE